MFRSELKTIYVTSSSSQSKSFELRLKRRTKKIKAEIQSRKVSILFWYPSDGDKLLSQKIHESKEFFSKSNINPIISSPMENSSDEKKSQYLKHEGDNADIVFVFIQSADKNLFYHIYKEKDTIAQFLIFFIDDEIEQQYIHDLKQSKDFPEDYRFTQHLEENGIFSISNLAKPNIRFLIELIRILLYIQEKNLRSTNSYITLSEIYGRYQEEVNIFTNESWLFMLLFVRYLERNMKITNFTPEDKKESGDSLDRFINTEIKKHIFISSEDLDKCLEYFRNNGFIDQSQFPEFTHRGEAFLYLFDLKTLPTLEEEKSHFKEKWSFPLNAAKNSFFKLQDDSKELERLSDNVYFGIARQYKWFRIFRYLFCKYAWGWWTKEEKEFMKHELGKLLLKIWRDNVGGVRRGINPESEEKAEFFLYLFKNLEVKWLPEYRKKFQDHRVTVFALRALRPNPYVHLYISLPFSLIPLKDRIEEYMRIAMRTGEYDFFLKKYPPYYHILNLYASPGDRTFVDPRMIDIWPYTYKLDLKLTAALTLNKIPTRSNKRFISCDMDVDENLEKQKQGLIEKISDEIKSALPSGFPGLMNFEIRDDGNVYLNGEFFPNYGPRRVTFKHWNDELFLHKAVDTPGPKSGLIIRFNLLDPIAVLVNGIEGERRFSIDEMIYLLKILDLMKKKVHDGDIGTIIDDVFNNPFPNGVSDSTIKTISQLNELRKSKPDDEAAWEFLTPELVKGSFKPMNQVINHCLISDGFEFVFNLWPLITGKEITMMEIPKNPYKNEFMEKLSEIDRESISVKNSLPLIDNLKSELETLLKSVFSKTIHISSSTKDAKSEPNLSRIVIEACLYPKTDQDIMFGGNIEKHLENHYKLLLQDAEDQSSNEKNADLFEIDISREIKKDAEIIMGLIKSTRNRLLNREINNRLLRFINPKSVNVEIGDFEYIFEAENENVIERVIEFRPEYHKAGISVLTHFAKVLEQKYPDANCIVRIEQDGLKVRLVIETPEGMKDIIEKTLDEYEKVVDGKISPEEFSDNPFIVRDLKNELLIAHLRVREQEKILDMKDKFINQLLIFDKQKEISYSYHMNNITGNPIITGDKSQVGKGPITIGDDINIQAEGDVGFGKDHAIVTITKMIEKSNTSGDLRTKLKELVKAVNVMAEKMTQDEANDVNDNLELLVKSAIKNNLKWCSSSGEELIETAKSFGQPGKQVVELVKDTLKILFGGNN